MHDQILPRSKPGAEKDWWNDHLTAIRNESISIHKVWLNEGRPRHGPAYKEHLRVQGTYKQALRASQRAPKQHTWNRLHSTLAENYHNSFWKSWNRLYSTNKNHLAHYWHHP